MGVEQHVALVGDVIDEHGQSIADASVGRRSDRTQPFCLGTGFDALRRCASERRRRLAVDLDIVGLRLAVLDGCHHFDAAETGLVEAGILFASPSPDGTGRKVIAAQAGGSFSAAQSGPAVTETRPAAAATRKD